MKTTLHRILRVVAVAGFLCLSASGRADDKKPAVARKPHMLRTYRFTAKIVYNGGITPFKVGTKISGEFTYDLSAKNESKLKWNGMYPSCKHRLQIQYRNLSFSTQGITRVNVSRATRAETFSIGGGTLTLPKGWRATLDPRSGKDNSYMLLGLQNVPPRKVLRDIKLPTALKNWKQFTTRTVRIDFVDGVRFPRGQVVKPTRIDAILIQLELSRMRGSAESR